MARLSKKELNEIIKRDMPGYKVVPGEVEEPEVLPGESAPDIEKLRKKYLGEEEGEALDSNNPGHGGANKTDDEIVIVEPEEPGDPYDHAARPKTVVVSGKDRRVIARQG